MSDAIEIVQSGNDAVETIRLAIQELENNSIYDSIIDELEEVIGDIENIVDDYREEADKENQAELDYMNSEYIRSVI